MQNTRISSSPPNSITVLTANVGNLELRCRKVLNKLCYIDIEEQIAKSIKLLMPDIIALQEVLAPWQCDQYIESNSKKVCFQPQVTSQVRRLLGDEYTIACNSRNQFECIGVRSEIGDIIGCEKGKECNIARTIPEIAGCDNGFTISAISIRLNNGVIFDVVNFHPQSTNSSCRAQMLSAAFFGYGNSSPIIIQDKVLLMGDYNIDPWRDKDESAVLWNTVFAEGWRGQNFRYHSGIAETEHPYPTSSLLFTRKTVDFIVSNFLYGTCSVLGETPGTQRLDGGHGTDHRAIYGLLAIKP